MSKILWSLLAIVLGTFLMLLVKHDRGYIIISYATTTVEMSFWFGIFLVFFLLGLSLVLFFGWLKSWGLIKKGFSWVSSNRDKRADKKTHNGLVHYIEGNWAAAKKELLQAAKLTSNPLVHYLAAAHSAHELGNREESYKILQKAEQMAPENELAVVLSQARMQLSDGQYEECLTTLKKVLPSQSKNPVVLDLLQHIYVQLRDWDALHLMLSDLKQSTHLSELQYSELEREVYFQRLDSLAMPSTKDDAQQYLTKIWAEYPKQIKSDSRILARYTQWLNHYNSGDQVEEILRKALSKEWQPELMEIYSSLTSVSPKLRLSHAEQWSKQRPEDALLFFAMGKIAAQNSLWGKAKHYFERSLSLDEKPEVYAEFGKLMAQMGEHEQSSQLYHKGLMLRT